MNDSGRQGLCYRIAVAMIAVVISSNAAHAVDTKGVESEGRSSKISDEAVPEIDLEAVPKRPKPLLELGDPFLGTGPIGRGIELPTGAVWQPSLLGFGTFRTALQAFNDRDDTFSEWANRLDLFFNLQLTGTERVLLGFRPLDEDGEFTGRQFEPDDTKGTIKEGNAEVTTLFFEGEIGELFPNADPEDFGSLDLGFSFGRQSLFYQEGMLINDDMDAFGIIRNALLPSKGTDLQLTFIVGWSNIHGNDNLRDGGADLYGVFVAADYPKSTFNFDFVYKHDDDDVTDGIFWGVSAVQRIGHLNTSFRALGSHALEDETEAVSDGYLLFSEVSWTPAWTHDNIYVNAFWGIDNFTSAARGPATGGPLGRVGILFAAVGLGRYGAALGNRPDDSIGAAWGYQRFLNDTRKQIVFEVGARIGTESEVKDQIALGARYQQAFGRHWVLQLDGFRSAEEDSGPGWGARVEGRVEF